MKLDSIKGRIFELSEFLADVAKFPTMKMRNSGRIYYHGSCHLMREIGVKDQPLKLLRMIEGIEIAESSKIKECCGFGGIFCVKYPHVSEDITKRVLSETGNVDCIIVNDAGCLITMNAILPQLPELKKNIRILHLAEFLNESMKNSD
jgi:L-lactate dehydrogenase complex protein LldE